MRREHDLFAREVVMAYFRVWFLHSLERLRKNTTSENRQE
jgi:hypothetical protein